MCINGGLQQQQYQQAAYILHKVYFIAVYSRWREGKPAGHLRQYLQKCKYPPLIKNTPRGYFCLYWLENEHVVNAPLPFEEHLSSALRREIAARIDSIRTIENSFPGAIIIHDLQGKVVYMSRWGREHLGISLEDLQLMGMEYYERFFNAEDAKEYVPKILGLLERNNDNEFISFFQQVRRSPEYNWTWYLSAVKIFFRDETGKPLLTLTHALPVDAQHHIAAKAQRLLEENNFLRNSYPVFNQLTRREKEILRLMALGESSAHIAAQLYISEKTAKTHRKNIRKKLQAESNYDITRYAQAFDLI